MPDWKQIKDAGDTFGWWVVSVVAIGYALHKQIFTLGRETDQVRKELERHRAEIETERDRHRAEMENERERHRNEFERARERHEFALRRWEDMADANNVLLRDAQSQLERATSVAEKLADKLAQLLKRDPT